MNRISELSTYERLALHRAFRNSLDDPALEDRENNHDRNRRQDQRCENERPFAAIFAEEHVDCQHQCIFVEIRQHQDRQQEVIPQPQQIQDDDSKGNRQQQRQYDAEKRFDFTAAIYFCGLVELARNPLYEAVIQEHRHACLTMLLGKSVKPRSTCVLKTTYIVSKGFINYSSNDAYLI